MPKYQLVRGYPVPVSPYDQQCGGCDVRYFNDGGMPITLDKRSCTNPNNSYYMIANIEPGPFTVIAYIGTTEVGRTRIVSMANSICIADIKVNPDNSDFTSNPTPADCE